MESLHPKREMMDDELKIHTLSIPKLVLPPGDVIFGREGRNTGNDESENTPRPRATQLTTQWEEHEAARSPACRWLAQPMN